MASIFSWVGVRWTRRRKETSIFLPTFFFLLLLLVFFDRCLSPIFFFRKDLFFAAFSRSGGNCFAVYFLCSFLPSPSILQDGCSLFFFFHLNHWLISEEVREEKKKNPSFYSISHQVQKNFKIKTKTARTVLLVQQSFTYFWQSCFFFHQPGGEKNVCGSKGCVYRMHT